MRLSGYIGPIRANKASKKQLKDVVFPTIMSYLQRYLVENPSIFSKPVVTTGKAVNSEIITQERIDEYDFKQLDKLYLHNFITGRNLIKLVIKKHNEAGFANREDDA